MPSAGDRQLDALTTLDLAYLFAIYDDAVSPRSVTPPAPVS